jgi:hypothetical protein
MNTSTTKRIDATRIRELLKQALPPADPAAEPPRDLWPVMLRRLDAEPAAPIVRRQNWFDWALLAALLVFAMSFPATIPVFLYYL